MSSGARHDATLGTMRESGMRPRMCMPTSSARGSVKAPRDGRSAMFAVEGTYSKWVREIALERERAEWVGAVEL